MASPLVHDDGDLCTTFDSCDALLHDYLLDVCNNNKFPDYCNDSEIGSKFSEFVHNITSLYPNIISHLHTCTVISCSLCALIKPLSISVLHSSIGFLPYCSIPVSVGSSHHSPSTVVSSISSYISVQSLYTGVPSFICKVAPVASHINFNLLGELSQGFHDPQILDLIQYGFRLDLDKSSFLPNLAITNHGSALNFPAEVSNYFREEIAFGSMLGPFPDPPFPDLHCSPHMTAPKDGSKRGVFVHLSFPSLSGHAVNSSVNKNSYVGTPFSLKLPTVDIIFKFLLYHGELETVYSVWI
jgi:hypothetical protein